MTAVYSLIFVSSISHALVCERVLEKSGISSKLIPVPRRFSSDCGVCIRVSAADRSRTETVLSETNTIYERIIDDS